MNRLTKAWTKYNFDIKYKKDSEMPADFLSRNAVEAVGIFDDNWKIAQEQDEYCEIVKTTHGSKEKLLVQCKQLHRKWTSVEKANKTLKKEDSVSGTG